MKTEPIKVFQELKSKENRSREQKQLVLIYTISN